MNSNFFKDIAAIDFSGNLQITIAKNGDSGLVVSVLLQNDACGDTAKNFIAPLTLIGSAEEMDAGFMEQINTPIAQVSGLMEDMEGFLAQMETAKNNSAMEKQKGEKERKEKEAKDKKYKEAMGKVETLEKEGRFRDAWTKLPDPAEFPEQAESIRKRKSELSARFSPDLFGAPELKAEKDVEQAIEEEIVDEDDFPIDTDRTTDEEE